MHSVNMKPRSATIFAFNQSMSKKSEKSINIGKRITYADDTSRVGANSFSSIQFNSNSV